MELRCVVEGSFLRDDFIIQPKCQIPEPCALILPSKRMQNLLNRSRIDRVLAFQVSVETDSDEIENLVFFGVTHSVGDGLKAPPRASRMRPE
jgi:hypothetical protein